MDTLKLQHQLEEMYEDVRWKVPGKVLSFKKDGHRFELEAGRYFVTLHMYYGTVANWFNMFCKSDLSPVAKTLVVLTRIKDELFFIRTVYVRNDGEPEVWVSHHCELSNLQEVVNIFLDEYNKLKD